jgi:hypothetical protein
MLIFVRHGLMMDKSLIPNTNKIHPTVQEVARLISSCIYRHTDIWNNRNHFFVNRGAEDL